MNPSHLTWKGFLLGLCIWSSILGVTPPALSQEVEPNNTCPTAQEVGQVRLPLTLEGELAPTTETLADVDFFQFTGTIVLGIVVLATLTVVVAVILGVLASP